MPRTKPTSLTAHRLAKQADAKLAAEAQPTEPTAQPEPEPMVVQIVLVFTVDGRAVAHAPMVAQVPRPADDQAMQLQLALDGRTLASLLEPHFGPSHASAKAGKIWTPGAGA